MEAPGIPSVSCASSPPGSALAPAHPQRHRPGALRGGEAPGDRRGHHQGGPLRAGGRGDRLEERRAVVVGGEQVPLGPFPGLAGPQLDGAGSAHQRDVVGGRDEVRSSVERVHAVGVAEADAAEHLLDPAGLRAHLADDALRGVAQQRGVDGAVGEQAADELLVARREAVSFPVAQPREAAPHGLPQVAGPVRLQRRQQLGQHLVPEVLAVHRDEQEADVRDEHAQPGRVAPPRRVDHEAPDLGRPVVAVADLEHRVDEVTVERAAVALLGAHVEEDVGRVATAELADDHGGAHGAALALVAEQEDVLAPARIAHGPREGALGVAEQLLDRGRVVREVDRVEVAGQGEQRLPVGQRGGADDVAQAHGGLPQNCLRESTRMVTGPSTTEATCMWARKRPVATAAPCRRSASASASSRRSARSGASASSKEGRRPRRTSP